MAKELTEQISNKLAPFKEVAEMINKQQEVFKHQEAFSALNEQRAAINSLKGAMPTDMNKHFDSINNQGTSLIFRSSFYKIHSLLFNPTFFGLVFLIFSFPFSKLTDRQ